MKQKLLYLLLLTVALVTGSSGAWAAEGDQTTNVDINFDGASVSGSNPYTIQGSTGKMTWTQQWTVYPYIQDNILRFGNTNGQVVTLENNKITGNDQVTISFDLAFGKLNGKHVGLEFRDKDGNTFLTQWFDAYNGDFDNANPLNLDWAKMYRGSNTVIQDRCVNFTIVLDYNAGTIKTHTKCLLGGTSKPATEADATATVNLTSTNILGAIVFTGNINNADRYATLDNLKVVTTEGSKEAKANYIVKWICGNDNIKQETRQGTVGSEIVLSTSDKSNFDGTDDFAGKRYIYTSDNSANKTISNDGSTVVIISLREAEKYEYTITSSYNSTKLPWEEINSVWEDQNTITVNYPRFQVYQKQLVEKTPNGNDLTKSVTVTGNNYTEDLAYSAVAGKDNIYLLSEAENLIGTGLSSNATIFTNRVSNKLIAFGANGNLVTIDEPGQYVFTLGAIGGDNSSHRVNYNVSAGEKSIIEDFTVTGNFLSLKESAPFYVGTNPVTISFTCSDPASSRGIDLVYIQRTGEAPMPGAYFKKSELSGEVSDYVSATISGNKLTLTSIKEGYGFDKIKLNMSTGAATANTGSINDKNVWTGNANEVVLTLSEGAQLNSIIINDGTAPELETVNTIAEFKAAEGETKLNLSNAEVLWSDATGTIVQDATGGVSIAAISISGAQPGKVVNGTIAAKPWQIFMMSSDQTDYTTLSTTNGAATVYTLTGVDEALNLDNVCRLVLLKGVTITEKDGVFYASDKTNKSIKVSDFLYKAIAEELTDGDILASLTGMTRLEGEDMVICPRSADDIVSGLIWQGDDLENGSPLNADLTSGDILEKMAELKAGDEIHIELMSLNNVELEGQGTPLTISTAAGKTIYTIYLKEENLQEGTVSFPITQDVVREINKHGMTIEADANVTIVYVEPGKYDAEEEDIWLSDETAIINGLEIGDAHFKDVRESDVVELEAADDLDMTIENYGETEEYISGDELSDEQAALLQDGKLIVEAPATGLTRISFYKNAVRDDKAEVTENEDGTYNSYKQGEKGLVNGMIMTFGGNDPEGAEYEFAEVYPEVNKFGSATEGIDQLPVDNDGKAFDKKQNNLPTKGTYYVFEPTKNGTLEITAGIEAGKTIVFAEEGGEAMVDQADDDYEGMNAVEVEATKTYYLFSPDSNLKFFGFTFTPADKDAKNVAKDIATFKLLESDDIEGDTLLLKDAVVTYIKGDNVFVEDATGAIDFYRTRIQYYVGQKLNGYIVGNSGFVSEEYPLPALLRTDATKYGQFKVTENVTPEATVIAMSETDDLMNVDRFVKLENVKVSTDNKGFKILTDGETSILIEDHFNVFYTLEENLVSIEGIIGMDKELTNRFWPTSQEGIVLPEQEASATLVHTAAVQGGSNEAGSSLDAVSHYYNNWGTTSWVAQAYAGFNLVIPENNTVTSAKLKFRSYCGGNRDGRAIDVYYKDGTDFNYSDLTLIAAAQAGTKVTSLTENRAESDKEVDVTEAVNAILAGGSDNIVFVFAGGAAGGQIYGKGSADYAPTLELTTVDASKTTSYTVNFVDANGKALKEAAIYNAQAVGATATASETDMAAFKNADGSKKYIYESGNDEITLVKNAESNVINLVFREAAMWSYTVNALEDEDNVLQTIKSGKDFEGETINVPTPRRLVIDGVVYASATTGGQESSVNVTLDADNKVASMTYTETEEANVVFFAEAEDIETMTVNTGAYVQVRCSNKAGGYAAEDAAIVTLKAGTYTITAASYASASTTFVFKAGDKEVLSHTGSGGWSEGKSDAFTLTADAVLTVKGGTKDYALDYLYIQSADGGTTGISNVNAERNNGTVYNLSGQKVNGSLKKGLYIINGKKVIVK